MVVLFNLFGDVEMVIYIDAGYWVMSVVKEVKKYCIVDVFDVKIEKEGKIVVLFVSEWCIVNNVVYVYFCLNEMIDGIEINDLFVIDKLIVVDMFLIILFCEIDVLKYGVIYVGV